MKAIVLDRDGVINEDSDDYIKTADEWQPIAGSLEAIARLHSAGYVVAVATNQSGLSRGYFDEYDLANIHQKMLALVEERGGVIDGIFYCPHGPGEGCGCRKPATGLLSQIETELDLQLEQAYFVGDSRKDLEAAIAFRMQPILVRTGKGRQTEQALLAEPLPGVSIFDDLQTAVDKLILDDNAG